MPAKTTKKKKAVKKATKKKTAMPKADETKSEGETPRRLTVEEVSPDSTKESAPAATEAADSTTSTDTVPSSESSAPSETPSTESTPASSESSAPVTSFSLVGNETPSTEASKPTESASETPSTDSTADPLAVPSTGSMTSSSEPLDLTATPEPASSMTPAAGASSDQSTDASGDWLSSSSSNSSGTMNKQKGSKMKVFVIILVILAVFGAVGGGIYYYTQNVTDDASQQSLSGPSPQPQVVSPTASPTPTAEAVDYSKLSLEILNGSGKAGEAGKAEDLVTDLGFDSIDTGNADSYDFEETEVALKADVSEAAYTQIMELLSKNYTVVKGDALSDDYEYDVQITVGSLGASEEAMEASPTPTEAQ